jgi:hypothetical protein
MGTFTIEEFKESRSYQLEAFPNECSLTAVYTVTWSPSSALDPYPGNVAMLAAVAKPRQRPNSFIHESDGYHKTLVSREVTVTPLMERTYAWRVTIRYSTRGPLQDGAGQFCIVTRSTSIRQAALYRSGATLPTNGTPSGFTDIAGTAVDLNGNPREYEVPQTLVSVEVWWDRTLPSGTPAAEPAYSTYSSTVGKRNNATFIGYPQGSLLYRGFQAAPIDNYYRITHTFLHDEWYHLEQIPAPNPTGQPVLVPGATYGSFQVLQADEIFWYQKYTSTAAFSSLVTAAQLSELTAPVPTAIP